MPHGISLRDSTIAQLGFFFRAKFHSKSLYSVEKKIVGISQYAYFSAQQTLEGYISKDIYILYPIQK
jgi:hypothetical protein